MDLKGRCPISNNENNNNLSSLFSRFESVFFKGCTFNRTALLSERKFLYKQANIKINLNVTSIQYCVDSCLYMYQFIGFNNILNECICLNYLGKSLEIPAFSPDILNKFISRLEINLVNKNDCVLTTNENLPQMYEIYSTGYIGDKKMSIFQGKELINLFLFLLKI